MINLKQTDTHFFNCITLTTLIILAGFTFPLELHSFIFFLFHASLGLSFLIYSHFIFPLYFSPLFCYFTFSFGANYTIFNIQLLLAQAFEQLPLNEFLNYSSIYYCLLSTFFLLMTVILLIALGLSRYPFKVTLFKKLTVMLCILVFSILNSRYTSNYISPITDNLHTIQKLSRYSFLLFATLLIIFCFLHYYKDSVSHPKEKIYCYIGIFVIFNLCLYYLIIFRLPLVSRLINQILNIWALYFFYKPISDTSLNHTIQTLNNKLLLHRENNAILTKYITNLSNSNEVITKQYDFLNMQYTQMLSVYPDALFILDEHFHIIHLNPNAQYLLEITSPSDVLHAEFTDFFTVQDQHYICSLLKNIFECKAHHLTTLSQLSTLKNNTKDVEISILLSTYSYSKQLIVSVRDISYRSYTHELEQQVTLEKLKVEFFSTLSHELKTPINVIYSATQLQNQLIESNEIAKIKSYNQMISLNCLRLLKLINNLLDLNRVDGNYFKVFPHTLNIVTFVEDILDSTLPYSKRKQINLLFDTNVEEIYCSIDPDMFERILLNLFSNAVKYGKHNGNIHVTVTYLPSLVQISILDDGIGIPPSIQQNIFDRFTRAENGLTRTNEGAGIGLSLVKSFVELNQGTISFTSKEHHGTEFILYFPCIGTVEPENYIPYNHFSNAEKVDLEFSDLFIS